MTTDAKIVWLRRVLAVKALVTVFPHPHDSSRLIRHS
jgi:hypothetical protein